VSPKFKKREAGSREPAPAESNPPLRGRSPYGMAFSVADTGLPSGRR